MRNYLIHSFIIALACFLNFNSRANNVSINADGVMVIDGQKVFPIGFTISPPPEGKTPAGKNSIAELADAGATFLRAGPLGQEHCG